jgi:uncharacterized protein (DUF433 family)
VFDGYFGGAGVGSIADIQVRGQGFRTIGGFRKLYISFGGITMNNEEIISRDPDILGGAPVFAGTRVPVDSLIAHLKEGDSLDDFLEGFPTVSRKQAEAFLELALRAAVSEGRDARAA